jgi:RNA polymerase sigma-70 factor (ECF subfamily)
MPDHRELQNLAGIPAATPESTLLRREEAKRLREAIQKLPPEYRLILVLHDMEELSDDDVAEITGLRPGTIRVRLHRARLFVRKHLAKQDQHRARPRPAKASRELPVPSGPRRCKQMFAELSNYLDDELDESLCEELEKHMDGCEPCKAFLSSLEKSIQQCRLAPNDSPDPRSAAKLRRELVAEYQEVMKQISKREPGAA